MSGNGDSASRQRRLKLFPTEPSVLSPMKLYLKSQHIFWLSKACCFSCICWVLNPDGVLNLISSTRREDKRSFFWERSLYTLSKPLAQPATVSVSFESLHWWDIPSTFSLKILSKHARDWKSPTFRRNTPQPTPVHYQWEINSPPTSHLTPHQKFSLSRWQLELVGSNYRTKPINTSMIWSKTRKQSRKLWVQHHPPPQSQGYISVRQVFITTGTASLDTSFTYHNKKLFVHLAL